MKLMGKSATGNGADGEDPPQPSPRSPTAHLIDKLIVTSAKSVSPDKTCSLAIGDEIVQVNQQLVPGQRALKVMRVFNGIKDGALCTLKVRRGNSTVTVVTK